MASGDFVYHYFIEPIETGSGYNLVNTTAYAFLLLFFLYLIFKVSRKLGLSWDLKAVVAFSPFIALTSFSRVLTDAGIYERSFWTVTPGIEFLILLPSIFLVFSLYYLLKENYWKYALVIGTVGCVIQLLPLRPVNFNSLFLVISYFLLSSLPLLFLSSKLKVKGLDLSVLLIHFFDASATSVALRYFNYFEQHVFPRFIISFTFPEIMFPLKLAVVGTILYLLKGEDEQTRFLKLVVFALGLGPGLRDTLRLLCGV
ncbi:hypothetical protein DRN62_03220 [Nanoarchaeota archaeon]|nr:MAG: hypothetical protein DRN62_03220 [Nanoarchaeota archaeon]